ncbi:MAG: hypothetical protein ACFFDP_00910, partial [Promethearchaeota archaeon]
MDETRVFSESPDDSEEVFRRTNTIFFNNTAQSSSSFLGVEGKIKHYNKGGDWVRVLIWTTEPCITEDHSSWGVPVEVVLVNSRAEFMNQLSSCSAAFILGSAEQDFAGQLLSSGTEILLNWVSEGNLLFIS